MSACLCYRGREAKVFLVAAKALGGSSRGVENAKAPTRGESGGQEGPASASMEVMEVYMRSRVELFSLRRDRRDPGS